MKNLFLALVATVFIGGSSFGNNTDNKNTSECKDLSAAVFCVTLSCCSAGPFGIEIWTHTVCYEIEVRNNISRPKITLSLESNGKTIGSKLEVKDDVILPIKDGNGNYFILEKGLYDILNDQLIFYPEKTHNAQTNREVCITGNVTGTFFGNTYTYSVTICIDIEFRSNTGLLTITPNLNSKELSQVLSSNNKTITFTDNIVINERGYNFIIEAGDYVLNEDGNIYMQHVKVK